MHRLDGVLHVGVSRNDDHRQAWPRRLADLAHQFQPAAALHVQLGDHQADGGPRSQQRQGLLATVGGDAGNTLGNQFIGQGIAPDLVVVHQQHAGRRAGHAHDFLERLQLGLTQQVTVTHGVILGRAFPSRPTPRTLKL
ncbi:hypothetical protein D3C85_1410610 [compost metagenome]